MLKEDLCDITATDFLSEKEKNPNVNTKCPVLLKIYLRPSDFFRPGDTDQQLEPLGGGSNLNI